MYPVPRGLCSLLLSPLSSLRSPLSSLLSSLFSLPSSQRKKTSGTRVYAVLLTSFNLKQSIFSNPIYKVVLQVFFVSSDESEPTELSLYPLRKFVRVKFKIVVVFKQNSLSLVLNPVSSLQQRNTNDCKVLKRSPSAHKSLESTHQIWHKKILEVQWFCCLVYYARQIISLEWGWSASDFELINTNAI